MKIKLKELRMVIFRLFQSLMVLGKNEFLKNSVRDERRGILARLRVILLAIDEGIIEKR